MENPVAISPKMKTAPLPISLFKMPPLYGSHRHGYCRPTVSLSELLAFFLTLSTVAEPLAIPENQPDKNANVSELLTELSISLTSKLIKFELEKVELEKVKPYTN